MQFWNMSNKSIYFTLVNYSSMIDVICFPLTFTQMSDFVQIDDSTSTKNFCRYEIVEQNL